MDERVEDLKDVMVIRYSNEEVNEWIRLYERFGSLRAVSRYLREQNNGKGPSTPTIKLRMQAKFQEEGRNFNNWVNQFKIGYYSDEDVQQWKEYYQKFGSFRKVCRYWHRLNKNVDLFPSTIVYRLKAKSLQEGWDFENWINQYKRGYSKEDVHNWKDLYERLGSFRAVSRYLCNNRKSKTPNASIILYRLKKMFQLKGKDFDEWVENFSRVNEILERQFYTQEELEEWEKLYEQYGSFSSVSRYLKYYGERCAVASTITRNLRKKFKQEGRNFNEWVNEYFSPDSDIASNIGRFVHNVLELIFIKFSLKNNLNAFFEVHFFDNVIINPEGKNKLLVIDYTIASDLRKITDKITRGYHGLEKKLIIVIFLSDKLVTLPENGIPHRKNIEIFNAQEFADFMGYKGNTLNLYDYVRYLARKAFYDRDAYKELKALSRNALNNLNRLAIEYSLRSEDFEKNLLLEGLEYLFE